MSNVIAKIAELLFEAFWLISSKREQWNFQREGCIVRVTVEVIEPKYEALTAYENITALP